MSNEGAARSKRKRGKSGGDKPMLTPNGVTVSGSSASSMAPPPSPPNRLASMVADRELLMVLGLIFVCFVILASGLWILAPGRSFHADELTNLRMHTLRERGMRIEEQHRFFHSFYAWWLGGEHFGERFARIPAMLFVLGGMVSFSALAGRLAGRWAALAAAVLFVIWPRTWDDGLEMRYYGFVFLGATLGIHALVSLARGWIYVPLAVLAALFVVMTGWHPTAVAWHGSAFMAGVFLACVTVWGRFRNWRVVPLEERSRFPWLGVGLPVLLASGGVIALLVALPWVSRKVSGVAITEFAGRIGQLKPRGMDLWLWFTRWISDPFSPHPNLGYVLVPAFTLLVLGGAVVLWRRQRSLLIALLAILILQLGAALLFRLSWRPLVWAPKYMTSSMVFLTLLAALGMVGFGALIARFLPGRGWLAAPLVGAFFVAPLLPRTLVSATGDASNFRQLWTGVMEAAGEQVPLALVVGEALQSSTIYRYLIPRFVVHEVSAEGFERNPVTVGLMARRNPVFAICHPFQESRFANSAAMVKWGSYPSNFTKVWDFILMGPPPENRLVAGSPAEVPAGESAWLAIAGGAWRLDGGDAQMNGEEVEAGSLISLDDRQRIELTADGPRRLIPALVDNVLRREAAFASDGPVDAFNRPRLYKGHRGYFIANVQQVEYDIHFPEEANTMVIEVERDEPRLGTFSVRVGRALVGVYTDTPENEDEGAGTLWEVVLPIPEGARGTDQTVSIAFHGENSIRRHDNDEVRYLKLLALRVERRTGRIPVTANQLTAIPLADGPEWAPGGTVDLRRPGSDRFLSLAVQIAGSWENPTITQSEQRGVSINMPTIFPSQIVTLPTFTTQPGRLLAFEITARGRNLITKNAAPMISYYSTERMVVRSSQLSQQYITSEDPDWTPRLYLDVPPADAAYAVIGFYLNCPRETGIRRRDDARIDIRSIRFYTPSNQ